MKGFRYFFMWMACVLVIPVRTDAQETVPVVKNGLVTATFKTKQGNVKVLLPADTRSGDMISGTVIAEPAGEKAADVEKNKGVLNGYVVELNEKRTPVSQGRDTWNVPETGIPAAGLVLTLLDPKGKPVGSASVPVNPEPRRTNQDIFPVRTTIPGYLTSGEPASASGAFSGNFNEAQVRLNGQEAGILAESPGQIIFECPEDQTGPADLELTEGGQTTRQTVHVLDLNLSATSTNLMKGESASVRVGLSGLSGMNEQVPLAITNLTPSIVRMEGGNLQVQIVRPGEVSSTGTWSKEITVTGITPGAFSIRAEIQPSRPDTGSVKPAFEPAPLLIPEYPEPLYLDAQTQNLYTGFARDAGILFDIVDYHLPKKYKFDPDKVTVARGDKKQFDDQRKKANGAASNTKQKVDSTEVSDRKELKGTVGFRVYYTKPDEFNCYWIISEWFSWKTDEYYKNYWKINRELDDILRFNNIKVDVNGNIDMEGSVETGGLETSAEIGIGIPIPGVDAGVNVSYSPPSTAALKAKGTLKGEARGYLNGKTLVVYIYKDTYHVERAYITYYFRYKQKYCNDRPAGPVIYETTMIDQWEKYQEIKYFADAFLVTEGIPTGPDSIHRRVESLVEDKHIDTDIKDLNKIQPGAGEDPSGFFEGVRP